MYDLEQFSVTYWDALVKKHQDIPLLHTPQGATLHTMDFIVKGFTVFFHINMW